MLYFFLCGEEIFTATPCRNFFHATHQEGCKRNLDASSIGIDHVNLPLCSYFAFCVFVFLWKQVCVPIIYIIINKWFICWFNKVYLTPLSILRLQKHKNTKARVCPPIFSPPYCSTSLFMPPDAPNRLLGCPILPFGVSHFTILGIPFCHLGYPISPFGVSHFTIWDIPFQLLGYIFGTFAHNVQPDERICLLRFSLQNMCVFFVN